MIVNSKAKVKAMTSGIAATVDRQTKAMAKATAFGGEC